MSQQRGSGPWQLRRKRSLKDSPRSSTRSPVSTEDIQLDKSFTDDLDVDTLSMVEVVVAAEERFDVKIPDEDVKGLKTVGDAADYILKHQS
jgi:acyl carrier protein